MLAIVWTVGLALSVSVTEVPEADADLLLRRAKLPTYDSTRTTHLERLMNRYWESPGNWRFSAEAVSRVAYNSTPYELGD